MVEDLPVIDNPTCNDYYGILNAGIMCIDSSDGKGVCNVSRDAPHKDDNSVMVGGQWRNPQPETGGREQVDTDWSYQLCLLCWL